MSKIEYTTTSNQLFGTDEDSDLDLKLKPEKKQTKRKTPASTSKSSAAKKIKIDPISSPPVKATARDLFGSDSEDEDEKGCPDHQQSEKKNGKVIPPLYSYITRRIANGYARQLSETKQGPRYVELKIYDTEEAERVSPINRWRHSVITIKTKTSDDTECWQHVKALVAAARRDFRICSTSFIPSSFSG